LIEQIKKTRWVIGGLPIGWLVVAATLIEISVAVALVARAIPAPICVEGNAHNNGARICIVQATRHADGLVHGGFRTQFENDSEVDAAARSRHTAQVMERLTRLTVGKL
jgi:hypothetical protein